MIEPERIAPQTARTKVLSGEALLVCAYDDEEKIRRMRLEGAISFASFKSRAASLPREQEIIFY